MSIQYVPWVREGLVPTAISEGRGQTPLTLTLSRDGATAATTTRTVTLVGPADVVGIGAAQVLRRWPTRGVSSAEPEFFPSIELDDPTLAWLASPNHPTGARVGPWIALVVVEEGPGASLSPGPNGGSPQVLRLSSQASSVLPDPADAWAWAHAQVEQGASIADTLASAPDETVCRLLCPRRLAPHTRYIAAVVPVYEAGRRAGLALGDPDAAGIDFAWSAGTAVDLPCYLSWSFQTGQAGDFESLARRLFAAPADPASPPPPLRVDVGTPEPSAIVGWRAAIAVVGAVRDPVPAPVVTALRTAMTPAATAVPVLAPPRYGSRWHGEASLGDDPGPAAPWMATANLDPSCRAAAGLGAELVRRHQDELMASAWRQLEEETKARAATRRRQLLQLAETRVSARLAQLPEPVTDRVFGSVVAFAQATAGDAGLFARAGRFTEARFLARQRPAAGAPAAPEAPPSPKAPPPSEVPPKPEAPPSPKAPPPSDIPSTPKTLPTTGTLGLSRTLRRTSSPTAFTAAAVADSATTFPAIGTLVSWAPTGRAFVLQAVATTFTAQVLGEVLPPPPDPVVPAPRFPRPLASWLAAETPDVFRIGAELPLDGVTVLTVDPAFVEAVLLGANEEMNRELLWRGFPCDARRTPFQWFWDRPHRARSALPPTDVPEIEAWPLDQPLGTQAGATGPALLVSIRSELIRRYPTAVLALVRGELNGTRRRPSSDPLVLPDVRLTLADDTVLLGFDSIDASELSAHPGWYVLVAENPGDPRFGLDPPSDDVGPPTPATLSWSHLTDPNAPVAAPDAFPVVAGLAPDTASSAHFASILRQRPFRALIHGSRLVRS